MRRIAESCVQDILARADIVAVVSEFVRLEYRGGRQWGLCPFHSERTPSFSVNPEKNFYYCFGCKKGGSPVSFLMELEKMSYPEALEHIARKAGVELVYEEGSVAAKEDSDRSEMLEFLKRAAGTFHHLLLNADEARTAREYLSRRALSPDIIEEFALGWAPNDPEWLGPFLRKKGYSREFLSRTGLFAKKHPDYPFFRGRIMFPIADLRGNIVAFGGRILSGDGPKYLNSAESDIFQKGRLLYGLSIASQAVKSSGYAILCEGYMDVISLHQAGVKEAVAPLGTGFTESQAVLLRRLAPGVRLSFDSDEAGSAATERSALICERTGLECSILEGLGAKDASEILEKEGPALLKKKMENVIPVIDFLVRKAKSLDTGGLAGANRAIRSLFPFLGSINAEVRKELCLTLISKTFGIEKTAVLRDFEAFSRGETAARPGKGRVAGTLEADAGDKGPLKASGDLSLMLALAVNRSCFPRIRSLMDVQDLENAEARKIFIALEESYRNDDDDMERFLARIGDDRIGLLIMEKAARGEFTIHPEKFIDDGVRAVRIRSLEGKRDEINRSITRMPASGPDNAGMNDLMYEKMYIDAELAKLKG
jgi:DNA primase